MSPRPPTKPVSDDEIRSLLDRYRCPVPFHVVRTRLLGNIASPDMTASPMDTVAGLWGGELPAIDNLDALTDIPRIPDRCETRIVPPGVLSNGKSRIACAAGGQNRQLTAPRH